MGEDEQSEQSEGKTRSRSKSKESEAASEPKFPVQRFREEAPALVGYPNHVVVGALHGSDRKEMTRSQVQSAVQKFLNREV